jgi:hypothetical protein
VLFGRECRLPSSIPLRTGTNLWRSTASGQDIAAPGARKRGNRISSYRISYVDPVEKVRTQFVSLR